MVSFTDISRLFAYDLKKQFCIEIDFCVAGLPDYQNCWMGKMPGHVDKSKEVYWFGLVPDGSQAYDFENFSDFANAPVFGGQSLKQVWERVELFSIDGCDPEMRIKDLVY